MPRVLKYLVDSRTPTDMVVFIHTGSYTGPGYVNIVIPHGLPFIPLSFGIYSIDDGVTWNSLEVTNGNAFGSTIIADATNITIGIRVEQSTTTTFLIKLFAFAPSGVYSIIQSPIPLSKYFIDSRKTYDQLLYAGTFQPSSSSSPQTIVKHDLGYKPRVMLWAEITAGTIVSMRSGSKMNTAWANIADMPIVTDTELQYLYYSNIQGATPPYRIHYRLYRGSNG